MIGKQQQNKVINFAPHSVVSTSATSGTVVDTKGFDYCRVDVIHNKASNGSANAKWLELELQHGTTTDPTNHTAIVGAVGTTEATATSSQFVLGVHNDTVNGAVVSFFVDLRNKERYLRVLKKAGESYHSTSNMITLSRANNMPDTASLLGVTAFAIV